MKKALVVGGTGPSGPYVLQGLLDRGFEVTVFHRGVHEPPDLPEVEHIHGDPHFEDTIDEALGDRRFDVVVAMYGRLRALSQAMVGRCHQLIGVGAPGVYRGFLEPARNRPFGLPVGVTEEHPLADEGGPAADFAARMLAAERSLFDHAARGAYQGRVVRYPQVYGPRNVVPWEWSVVRRVLDGRPHMILPDDGLRIVSRCAAQNAAQAVLSVVDNADVADGRAYNCADADQYTQRQWAELVMDLAGGSMEIVGIPGALAGATIAELNPAREVAPFALVDSSRIRRELGYRDAISGLEALRETVKWLIDNPPVAGQYAAYADTFDYDAEDRLIAAYRRGVAAVYAEAGRDAPEVFHPLPHPKAPAVGVDERGR